MDHLRRMEPPPPSTHCSFCGRTQRELEYLVGGPGEVAICDECVVSCAQLIAERRADLAREEEMRIRPFSVRVKEDPDP